jgi:receptor protein-tyrosine kinase
VITSGSATGDWAQIGKLEMMRACIAQLRARFDYVLIDAPILGNYPDVMSLGILADGVILVLQAHSTRREVACRVKHELEASGVQVLGAVLNDRTFPIPEGVYLRL